MGALTASDITVTLRDWIEANVAGWRHVELKPRDVVLGSGFSAEIFFVDAAYDTAEGRRSQSLVVRRQPTDFEVVPGSSLALQGQMMAAVEARGGIAVPPWIGMELDPAVLGMPFLIMGEVGGHAATMRPNYNAEGWVADMDPARRASSWKNGIEAFARLAAIDWRDGFDFLARPDWGAPGLDQYLGHLAAWHAGSGRGRPMLYADAALEYVLRNKPSDAPVNVLWGDPTPSNVMFDDEGKVNALIDWELAGLGPAELDLAWWLYYDDLFSRRFGVQRLEGLPSRAETIAIWEAKVGRQAENLDYYDIVVGLRSALIAVGTFDREVGAGHIPADNESLNANFMTLHLAERLAMPLPVLGADFHAFMNNVTPVGE